MPSPDRCHLLLAAPVAVVALLLFLQISGCGGSFLSHEGSAAVHSSGSNAHRSRVAATSSPCNSSVLHANNSAVSGYTGSERTQANMSSHVANLQKLVSRSVRFPGSGAEGRQLHALEDFVYVRDTPEADALVGNALATSNPEQKTLKPQQQNPKPLTGG